MAAVRKDLQTRQLQMLAETEKLMHAERRVHNVESQLAMTQSNCVKLQLEINKLRMKYEPGTTPLCYCSNSTLYKKFVLMLMRRMKAYSSSGSVVQLKIGVFTLS